jgi:predicted RNase H-like HicB family nuclease
MSEPVAEHRMTVRAYEVIVRTDPGVVHVTCPDLPQLDVRDETLAGALARAEDAIDAIWAGEFVKPLPRA